MYRIGSNGAAGELNQNLVDMLLKQPRHSKQGKNSLLNNKGGVESTDAPTFEETMQELADTMPVSASDFGSSAPAQTQAQASDISSMTSDQILSYSAEMIQNAVKTKNMEGSFSYFELNISMVSVEITQSEETEVVQTSDPLVLDLNKDGKISVSTAESGIRFDITGDGKAEQTAFVTNGDGVLALDRDGDGKITSGRELFGEQNGSVNGFLELSKYDENSDGVIDKNDSVFSKLSVVTRAADGSLVTKGLSQYGITSLSLQHSAIYEALEGGSYLSETGTAQTRSGEVLMADANFAYVA